MKFITDWTSRAARSSAGALIVLALVACDSLPPGTAPDTAAPTSAMHLTILHINDHHSHLDSKQTTLTFHQAGGTPWHVKTEIGGFARVTAAMQTLASASPHVVKLHAGDALTGTLYYNRAGEPGVADAAMMNTVCFDAMVLGNHEFDQGDSHLKRFIELLHQGACKTPVLSANVRFGPASALNTSRAPDWVKPSQVIMRDGQAIGVIGLTIAHKTQQSSSPDSGTLFLDETTAAQQQIDALRSQGVNKIIVLSHIGYDYDKQIIPNLSGVDVVVGGDSHTLLGPASLSAFGIGTPAGPYPTTLKDKEGKLVCLVQAWEYSQIVGELNVHFDHQGDVVVCSGTPHVLIGEQYTVNEAAASGAELDTINTAIHASGFLRVQTQDAQALAVLQPFKSTVDAFSASQVAIAPQELCSRRVPGGPGTIDYSRSSPSCNARGQVNQHGGDIQQFVAEAFLTIANRRYGGADISLQSGGGVRVPLVGPITAANVIEVLPFGNMLWRLNVTGREIKDMLEDGLQAVFGPHGATGPYPYTAGLRFDVHASHPHGQRVSKLEVYDLHTHTWGPLAPARMYRLFVLAFNATGGDGYKTLASVPSARRQEIGVLDADVLQAYIDQQSKDPLSGLPVLHRLPIDQYSTQRYHP